MDAGRISELSSRAWEQQATVESRMLDLFAPSRAPSRDEEMGPGADAPLWKLDATHRLNNMAQLSVALAQYAGTSSRNWLSDEAYQHALSLSKAYDALGHSMDTEVPVPCADLLANVVIRLTSIFGQARGVVCTTSIEAVELTADKRRALVLAASELVINALKYGFPGDRGGTISVALKHAPSGYELEVEDDGLGVADDYVAGTGSRLLEQLAAILNGTLARTAPSGGHGFCVTLSFSGASSARATA